MDLIERAFKELYPDREYIYRSKLKYSGKFAPYNANIRISGFYNLEMKLSKSWHGIDKEIIIGLIQDLLLKVAGGKNGAIKSTLNIKLYNNFIKNLHLGINKDKIDPFLKRSFDRVNEQFFSNQIETPNLVWGSFSKRKLGCYNFHTDTISMSKIFLEQDIELLDYVMYHEILHKSLKFRVSNGKHAYHTSDFRKAEKSYPNGELFEKRLRNLSSKVKKKSIFAWFNQ